MSEEKLRVCRYCTEQIKATAKVCPRCRQWLSPFSLRNPAMLIGATAMCFFLVCTYFIVSVHKEFGPGRDFAPYRNQISIVESHMCFGTNWENAPFVCVIAVVTNQTDKEWREVEIEARYFNKAGTLIDVGRGDYYDTLYPKTDGAIRIGAEMFHPLADYDSYKLYIGSAKDAHSRFE